MEEKKQAFQLALVRTAPIFAGFSFLGIAYGILMNANGFSFLWPTLISIIVYAGSMEFVAVSLLTGPFDPLGAFLLTLMVNARHLFYGISMLDKFRDTGRYKPYLIFGMCDETFSINCFAQVPAHISQADFMFFVTLLNHIYWVLGSMIGGILGSFIPFSTKGIDFVMTALFVVIFLDQWKSNKQHAPALAGLAASVVCLLVFGAENFIIPAMLAIVLVLSLMRARLSQEVTAK